MKILVTGGLGFIGSNFILNTLNSNPDVEITNIDAELYGSNHKSLKPLEKSKKYHFVKGNITNQNLMGDLISQSDCIVNFAAESFVDRSIANAAPFLDSNINGVFTILEIIKKQKKRFLQVSTDEVFGSLHEGTALESSAFNPSSPYAATKACSELLINSYHKTYDCDVVITRCTNNYGPRQFPEKLIPKIIILALQNKNIPIYGKGNNLRDWLYVDDHCKAIFQVLTKGVSGESYNISAGNEINNLTIANKILAKLDKSSDLIKFVEDRPGHDFRYSMNSTKIHEQLHWNPKISFDEGLTNTINWYVKNRDWWEDLSAHIFGDSPWKN